MESSSTNEKERLRAIAGALGRNVTDADEVYQDALVGAWTNTRKFRGKSSMTTLIYPIMPCAHIDHTRAERRKREDSYEPLAEQGKIDHELSDRHPFGDEAILLSDEVWGEMDLLNEKERAVFWAYHFEREPFADVARSLEIAYPPPRKS